MEKKKKYKCSKSQYARISSILEYIEYKIKKRKEEVNFFGINSFGNQKTSNLPFLRRAIEQLGMARCTRFFQRYKLRQRHRRNEGRFVHFLAIPPFPESQYSIRLFTVRTMASNPILLVVTKVTTIPWERCWQNSRFPYL